MKKEMNILTASLPSDVSVVIHSDNSSNDSEAETTVLTQQVMQHGKIHVKIAWTKKCSFIEIY